MTGPPPTRHGRSPYLIVSAPQKAIRRGQVEQAAAFALELTTSGHGAWCFARLKTIACEDVSPEATGLVADVHALADQWKQAKGKGDLHWLPPVRAAVALALAPKSRIVDWLVMEHAGRGAPPTSRISSSRASRRTRTVRRHSTVERCGRTRWLANAEADHGGAIRGRRARAYRRTTGAAAAKE